MGVCWAPPGRGHHHRSEGATHSTLRKRKTAITFLLAAVGSNGVQGSALSHWLVGVDVEHGPDGLDSPTFLKQNFDVLEAVHLIPIILETERKENYASYTAIQKDYKNYTIGIIDFKSYIP